VSEKTLTEKFVLLPHYPTAAATAISVATAHLTTVYYTKCDCSEVIAAATALDAAATALDAAATALDAAATALEAAATDLYAAATALEAAATAA